MEQERVTWANGTWSKRGFPKGWNNLGLAWGRTDREGAGTMGGVAMMNKEGTGTRGRFTMIDKGQGLPNKAEV